MLNSERNDPFTLINLRNFQKKRNNSRLGKMRILHIIDTLSMGGAENMLIGLTSGQISHGHEVTIMPLVCPGYTPVRAKIEESGVVVKPAKSKGSVYNPFIIPKIAKELKYFDIIHVHLFPAFYWVFFAKLLVYSPAPMIYTEHSTNNKRRNKALWHMMDKWVYQRGYKKIVACAEKVLDTFTIAFPSIKHTCYINNGVNIKAFSEASSYSKRELLGVDENTFVVTMVARFMTMKRQDTIVEALPRLSDNIHAVFVGGEEGNSGLIAVKDLS